jgi:hypothetical protein
VIASLRDPEQPRAQLEVPPLLPERSERPGHRALQRVLRILVVAQQRPAVPVQRLVVALIDLRERGFAVARAGRRATPDAQERGETGGGYESSPSWARMHFPSALPCLPPHLFAAVLRACALAATHLPNALEWLWLVP